MIFINPYFTIKEKIEGLQRWIIVQSYLYYETDLVLVTDKVYDDNCKQLVELQSNNPKDFKKSNYYYCFYDFDGSTGFDLYYRLNENDKSKIDRDVNMLLMRFGNGKSKKEKKPEMVQQKRKRNA